MSYEGTHWLCSHERTECDGNCKERKYKMAKVFTAHYRWREANGTGPHDYFQDITEKSLKKAKQYAKSLEGSKPEMQWFMDIKQKDSI